MAVKELLGWCVVGKVQMVFAVMSAPLDSRVMSRFRATPSTHHHVYDEVLCCSNKSRKRHSNAKFTSRLNVLLTRCGEPIISESWVLVRNSTVRSTRGQYCW